MSLSCHLYVRRVLLRMNTHARRPQICVYDKTQEAMKASALLPRSSQVKELLTVTKNTKCWTAVYVTQK